MSGQIACYNQTNGQSYTVSYGESAVLVYLADGTHRAYAINDIHQNSKDRGLGGQGQNPPQHRLPGGFRRTKPAHGLLEWKRHGGEPMPVAPKQAVPSPALSIAGLKMAAHTLSRRPEMKKITLALAAAAVAASTTASLAEWTKIGPGPSYDIAEAQCSLMAMGSGSGFVAMGSTEFVAGAAIGNAIGNAIQASIVKQKCMTIQGWKFVRAPKGFKTVVDRRTGQVKKVAPTKSYGTAENMPARAVRLRVAP